MEYWRVFQKVYYLWRSFPVLFSTKLVEMSGFWLIYKGNALGLSMLVCSTKKLMVFSYGSKRKKGCVVSLQCEASNFLLGPERNAWTLCTLIFSDCLLVHLGFGLSGKTNANFTALPGKWRQIQRHLCFNSSAQSQRLLTLHTSDISVLILNSSAQSQRLTTLYTARWQDCNADFGICKESRFLIVIYISCNTQRRALLGSGSHTYSLFLRCGIRILLGSGVTCHESSIPYFLHKPSKQITGQ